mmetsp:Transcript_16815/g.20212  ORF Transcript_16815/g.20212 Transcript_16815/m.20212 type:complete len:123 (+) Transcript_16815:183-551(+)
MLPLHLASLKHVQKGSVKRRSTMGYGEKQSSTTTVKPGPHCSGASLAQATRMHLAMPGSDVAMEPIPFGGMDLHGFQPPRNPITTPLHTAAIVLRLEGGTEIPDSGSNAKLLAQEVSMLSKS